MNNTLILQGVVGSTAYGLAREGSDVDTLGVFVAPTVEIAGLDWTPAKESIVRHEPDETLHEVGKLVRLLLNGNPTVTELLWLNEYTVQLDYGAGLVSLRKSFLCDGRTREAYREYARRQMYVLGYADDNKRKAKYARHMLRLLRQGRMLLETGELQLQVDNPQEYFDFDEMSNYEIRNVFQREYQLFTDAKSVLPAKPDTERVKDWLMDLRIYYVEGTR